MKIRKNGSTPDTHRMHDLIDQLSADIASSTDGSLLIDQTEGQFLVDVMIWTCNFLNDRRIYHKKQQLVKREIEKLMKQQLSTQDLQAIQERAGRQAELEVLPTMEVDGEEENA